MTKKRDREWGRWVALGPSFKEGGQGRLYLVSDSNGEFNGEYVLKELKNPKRLDRFNAELNAIASLDGHPHIVPLIDSGIYRDPKKPCFVMPKADGTLEDIVNNNSMRIEDLLIVFDQICSGVAYLHNNSIIHRDIKPENILMYSGIAKVSDLGLCLVAGTERLTLTPEAVGPRFYMAPELEDGKKPDVKFDADVYSLGKVLYYILSGGKIFSREKQGQKEWRLSKNTGDKRLELFDPVFDNSITVERYHRYKNAGEFQQGFREALHKYRNHPVTTLLGKFKTMFNALGAPENDLQTLTEEEWAELLKHATSNGIRVDQRVLNIACNALAQKFAKEFVEALFANEEHLNPDFIATVAGKILCLPETDAWFSLWLNSERLPRLVKHALKKDDDNVLNAIANGRLSALRGSGEVIEMLADFFYRLQPEGKLNFLIASVKETYRQKERLLMDLSHNQNLDNLTLEAIIAGLCTCATPGTIDRVLEFANNTQIEEKRLGAIGRGIVLGSTFEIAKNLNQHQWNNPVIKLLIEAMQKEKSNNANDLLENNER